MFSARQVCRFLASFWKQFWQLSRNIVLSFVQVQQIYVQVTKDVSKPRCMIRHLNLNQKRCAVLLTEKSIMHFFFLLINYSWHVLQCRCGSLCLGVRHLWKSSPLLWASSWERELTATLHSEQYRSFLALSSSVSPLPGVAVIAPGVPAGSGFEDPQPGEELLAGWGRGVVGLGMRAAEEEAGESGVGGADTGADPCTTTGLFSCDTGCVSSVKQNSNEATYYYRLCLFFVFVFLTIKMLDWNLRVSSMRHRNIVSFFFS